MTGEGAENAPPALRPRFPCDSEYRGTGLSALGIVASLADRKWGWGQEVADIQRQKELLRKIGDFITCS